MGNMDVDTICNGARLKHIPQAPLSLVLLSGLDHWAAAALIAAAQGKE